MTNKKTFRLINGPSIHIESGIKVLKKDDLGDLIDAETVLKTVKKDADQYRSDVIKEIEEQKAHAVKEGYEEGYQTWLKEIGKLEEEIVSIRKEYEKIIIPVLLKAVKKIVGNELANKPETIIDIVANSLKAVSTHKKIILYVSPKEKAIIEANKGKLKGIFEQLEVFSIRERGDILPGGCVIETEGGIINAQIDNQWKALERAFSNLFTNRQDV